MASQRPHPAFGGSFAPFEGRQPARRRPADDTRVLASWQRGAVHIWGWDGTGSAPPFWLYSAGREPGWPGPPTQAGFLSSLDVTTPGGVRLRPMSARLDPLGGAAWLRRVTAANDSVSWFSSLATLADRAVHALCVTPQLRVLGPDDDGDAHDACDSIGDGRAEIALLAQWIPVADDELDAALGELAAAMPPICAPGLDPDDHRGRARVTAEVYAAFVDGAARRRLIDTGWRLPGRGRRNAELSALRAVFGALASEHGRLVQAAGPTLDAVLTLAAHFERLANRRHGLPAVVGRVRLTVPEDRLDPWAISLELVDEADPGRWCTAGDVAAETALALELAGDSSAMPVLRAELSRVAQLASRSCDALAAFAAAAAEPPAVVELDVDDAVGFLEQCPAFLERFGLTVIGPEHLVRANVAVRGRAVPAPPSDRAAGFNRDTIVKWSLTVAEDGAAPTAVSDAELERAELLGSTLLHTGQRWVRIDPAALRTARRRQFDYAQRLDGDDDDASSALALVDLAGDVAAAGDELGVDDDAAFGADATAAWTGLVLGGLPDESLTETTESAGFGGVLRPYQRRGLSWLRFLHRLGLGGCLADDMGLGKTATTLAHLLDLPGPHLVVCPLSVVHNWETECRRFAPRLATTVHHGANRRILPVAGDSDGDRDGGDTDIDIDIDTDVVATSGDESALSFGPDDLVVTTYGVLTRDLEHLAAVDWSVVVLDEAQFVKNPVTKAARAARKLRSTQRLALTGTPVENRLGELWALLDWVNPGMLGSRDSFRHKYSKPIERGDGGPAAQEAAQRLRAITRPFVLRRSKSDRQLLPDLPDKIEQVAFAGLTREQGILYQKVVDELLTEADQREGMKRRALVLGAITRLKQICNHPAQALGDDSRVEGRSGKLARFDELVAAIVDKGDRALVFTQFVAMGKLLRRHLAAGHGWDVPFLEGSVSKSRRDAMVADFQAGAGPPLLLISLRAGGTGLNLTAATQVIHYDRWWNPAVEDQATDRAWRIGQHSTVLVHKLVCEGTVEERIDALINDKKALANSVVGQGETWLSELSTAELRQLVALTSGADGRVSVPAAEATS